MNTANGSVGGIGTTHFEEESDGIGRIGFVAFKIVIGAIKIADEFLWPMALLTGFLGGTEVLDGCKNRAGILVG